jgi:hypothetical protein
MDDGYVHAEDGRPRGSVCICSILEQSEDVLPLIPKREVNHFLSFTTGDHADAYKYVCDLFTNLHCANSSPERRVVVSRILGKKKVAVCVAQMEKCMFAQDKTSRSRWMDPYVQLACYVALYCGQHRDGLIASAMDAALVSWDKRKLSSISTMVGGKTSPFRFTSCLLESFSLLTNT